MTADPVGPGDALLVIDVQRKYVEGGAPLEVPGAPALVERIAGFAAHTRAAGATVVWITREGRAGTSMGAGTAARFGADALYRPPWSDLDPRLQADDDDVRVVKLRQSAFYGTDLEVVLRGLGVRRVLLAGVTTNVCVLATGQDARARDLDVVVIEDLTAALPITVVGHELPAEDVQAAALAFVAYAVGAVASSAPLLGAAEPAPR